ncbi:MAG: hypothetical protein JRH06_01205 [Deltaproteobacteria bacterium]|nr:hypothetical protein [Deltaproteobacteria bacterium]MBW2136157.1 hypothetical protein [Deltaproteobacteria bacterium]
MHIYRKIYEFAASAGALEGYVYGKKDLDLDSLRNWVDNLVAGFRRLPGDVADEIQPGLDMTIGRAIRSLAAQESGEHEILEKLGSLVKGALPHSPDDFNKKKWFEGDL